VRIGYCFHEPGKAVAFQGESRTGTHRSRIFGFAGRSCLCTPRAPGHGDYNGGRWKVVEAFGITSQLTNADAVVAAASSLVDTGTRFVCPLIET
jgi:hypothetical protein